MVMVRSLVLLIAMMLGMTSLGHFEGDIDHSLQIELGHALDSQRPMSCECHECDNLPCGMDVEIESTSRCSARIVAIPESKVTELSYREVPQIAIQPTLRVSDNIIALRTVQMLI